MSFINNLVGLIVILIAFAYQEKSKFLLNNLVRQFQNNNNNNYNNNNNNLPTIIKPIKSLNPVPSTFEEQRSLLNIEEKYLLNVNVENKQIENTNESPIETENESKNQRWKASSYFSATNISDSVLTEISKVILCTNGLHTETNSNSSLTFDCEVVKEIVKNSLYGFKSKERVIFGFRMKLEIEPNSAASFRLKLHDSFIKKLWPAIKKNFDFANENREIIFVGYESGGSLAGLAGWRALKEFDAFKPAGLFVNNANNQVKVITWDELPLFTKSTALKSPFLSRNYSRYTSLSSVSESKFRNIVQHSGGIDEIQYFAGIGEEISLKSTDYSDFSARIMSQKSSETKFDPTEHFSQFIKKTSSIDSFSIKEIERISILISLHHQHLSILYGIISNNYRKYIIDTSLNEPNSCAASLSEHLSASIFPDSHINCRVSNYDSAKGTFGIYCSYTMKRDQVSVEFLSFDAILGDESAHLEGSDCLPFMEETEIEVEEDEFKIEIKDKSDKNKFKNLGKGKRKMTRTKVLKYSGPAPFSNDWSECIYDLFAQKPNLSIISPFSVKENVIYPQCSYIPFAASLLNGKSGTRNTGCYLRSPEGSRELLQLYKSNPIFFYKTVDLSLMKFPKSCFKVLFHIPFKANDRIGLEQLEGLTVKYFTQLVSMNPFANGQVTLWRPSDTKSFKTLAFVGSENISSKDLSNRSNYEVDFENKIIKCLSDPSYPYRDCSDPINKWVPMACPAACAAQSSNPFLDFHCKQVKSCPIAGYYVAIFSSGTIDQLKIIQQNLMENPSPQFGFLHIQTRNRLHCSHFGPTEFKVALYRMIK